MKLNSHNEWDKLKEIILGTITNSPCLPYYTNEKIDDEKKKIIEECAKKAFPEWIIEAAQEDLENLNNVLSQNGVNVLRTEETSVSKNYATMDYTASGDRMFNPRDLNLIVGNKIIETPSQEKYRLYESNNMHKIFYNYFDDGCEWISSPKPRLIGDYLITKVDEGGHKYQVLKEDEMIFEAANIVRMGKDLLYLVSRSGNKKGLEWLRRVLGTEYNVHETNIYKSSHIDSTVMCLKPGLVVLNALRVNEKNCPEIFDKWDKIYFHDIVEMSKEVSEFHEEVRKPIHKQLKNMGIFTDVGHMGSSWIGMNFLSIAPDTVIVDEYQTKLIKILESRKLKVIPIKWRYGYLFKGGIHCCTLDTVRQSQLESYF